MEFIISLTSFGRRLMNTAPSTIKSLLDQTEKADRIILWLSYDTIVPKDLAILEREGLEIKFCPDFKSYNKLIPALTHYPNDILITVDDDVYYPKDWFRKTKLSYIGSPFNIHVNRAHEIKIENETLQFYKDWRFCVTAVQKEISIFPTGVGGILYPPKSLHPDVLCSSIFSSLAPKGDDIWFWAMARLYNTKYTIVEKGYKDLVNVDPSDTGMWINNVFHNGNDIQLIRVLQKYPKLLKLLEELI
ncbi:hypothetical protein [Sphingobacterium bovisgrunnientis]|uniref:hypothetical protein n=1 Tax=Sphingobacterium bovisgrunnientis TaxID=1874697 RepID=UPI00135A24C0|nr:hypothetical protein [Sphingobacterium bovisgrunnientis]